MKLRHVALCFIIVGLAFSCTRDEKLFTVLTGPEAGIDFRNVIVTNDTFNALSFEYIYNGAGVGTADFNNDGLADLFFGGNQAPSKLYLNEGNMKFRDVTKASGIETDRWITGVSVVDINSDGMPDIYLSVGGEVAAEQRRNLLFINKGTSDGVPRFVESAKSWGIDSDRYSTMAAFFDFDKDGDLDLYLLNNWLENFNRNNLRPRRLNGEAESTDQLFRNEGNTFVDASRQSGILIEGYGLGVAICDVNEDSWPDVYVANDFMSNDILWINQRDGTFKNDISDYIKHQTHNGMGVDVADFNNDALADIIVVDMLPPGNERQKMMTPGQNYDHFHMSLELGYQPQYMRNTLQLNRGRMPDGRILFSEIAFLSKVSATDWSWAPLFADFDNDGYKDLFVANGYRKDVTNLDFVFFGMENNPFGTNEAREKIWREKFATVPDVKISNFVFRNNGTLTFEDKTTEWGLDFPTFSNGAAYADLDNDGDLDIVTNNIDQDVIIYKNNLNERRNRGHYIRLRPENSNFMNEKIRLYCNGKMQYIERTPYRGFQSTVESDVHFGLGDIAEVDSIVIHWPNQMVLTLTDVPADTTIVYSRANAMRRTAPSRVDESLLEMKRLANYKHSGSTRSDIKSTRTLLHELSRYGPALASADVNGDGLDDFFVGGETTSSSRLFFQQPDGSFVSREIESGDNFSDGYAQFFDADGDGDPDLYIGKSAINSMEEADQHRLLINDGRGTLIEAIGALPRINASASCVEVADMDGDGDLDLFVGARFRPGSYPLPPQSYVLRNDGGKFSDVTESVGGGLFNNGMISSAVWADFDKDGSPDLLTAGEWQPLRLYRNERGHFTDVSVAAGLDNTEGWWTCAKVADINGDGFPDVVAGNSGTNSFFCPERNHPVEIVAKDFDNNGSVDPVITYYNPVEDERFIVHNRLVLIDQIPGVKRRFETFTQYATRPFSKVFTEEEMKGAYVAKSSMLQSVVLVNDRKGGFAIMSLPEIAQISSIQDLAIDDLDGDGNADILAIGNMYAMETLFGRFDASVGTVLLGDGKGKFSDLSPAKAGFVVDGDARYIRSLRTNSGVVYVVTNHNDSIRFFSRRARHTIIQTAGQPR